MNKFLRKENTPVLRNPGRSLGRYLLLPWTASYAVLGVAAVVAVAVVVYKLVS